MKQLLLDLNACEEARIWAGDKSWPEIFETCHRGDWLLWLFAKTNPTDLRQLTLAKGHCANTVRHLMKDKRSIAAVDAAIAFGEGLIDEKQLVAAYAAAVAAAVAAADDDAAAVAAVAAADDDAAAYVAAAASYAAYADAADAASYAAAAASYASYAVAYAAVAAYAAAKTENQKQTADICRKYLPIKIWNI